MSSRRRALRLAGVALASLAGCLDRSPGGRTGTRPTNDAPDGAGTPARSPTGTPEGTDPSGGSDGSDVPEDLPEPAVDWRLSLDRANLLGVDPAPDGDVVHAAASDEDGGTTVAALAPDGTERWRRALEGELVGGSAPRDVRVARDQWGVTPTSGSVLAVTGRVAEGEWSAVHALDAATGGERWSHRAERDLAVAGATDDRVVVAAEEFFVPDHSHDTPAEPLSTVVSALDRADGSERWRHESRGVVDVGVGRAGGDAPATFVADADGLLALDPGGDRRFRLARGPARAVRVGPTRCYYVTGADGRTVLGVAPDGSVAWRRRLPTDEYLRHDDGLYAGGDAVVSLAPSGAVRWRADGYGRWLLPGPDGERLYTRTGRAADAVGAHDVADGARRWTFDPPARNAWPEAATGSHVLVDTVAGPLYLVDAATGRAVAATRVETVFDAEGVGDRVLVGDGEGRLTAYRPPG
jgi:outer membrane protein assembly factor BamB